MIIRAIEQAVNEFLIITFAETLTNASVLETITLFKNCQ